MMRHKITLLIMVLFTMSIHGQNQRYTIDNLNINNDFSNFGTSFYGDKRVVYSSPKKSYIIKNNWKGNNQPFLDLFIGDMESDGQLTNIEKFSNKLNTRYHEADVAFTKDLKTVYFSRNNYFEKVLTRDSTGTGLIQLYRAKIDPLGRWINEEPMPFNNDQYQTGHPTLSEDERTLYFISDMPGGFGKTDVYKASISDNGTIGNPINLGSKINTAEREMFCFISGKDELYFSSDGRSDGLGELDVYVSKISKNSMTEPQNLGTPINSVKDDFSFIINDQTGRGYFSSNRDGGKGDDDIYAFNQHIPLEFECDQFVTGTVTENNTGELLSGSLVVLFNDKGEELERTIVGDDARFDFEVACSTAYKVIGSKEAYSTDQKEFKTTSINGEITELLLVLEKQEFIVQNDKCILNINPIYFDFDKSYIRPDAASELDKIVAIMKKYPELIIEGGSHTDSRATYKYNVGLSSRRAASTVSYIIGKGISSKAISSKGYGEYELLNKCANDVPCTEKEHQFNRRTEFVIVNFEEIKKLYPEICDLKATSSKEQIKKNFNIKVDPKTNF